MKGISAKIVTNEETVRMHTNFAEFENAYGVMAASDIATWIMEDGVLKVHTNTIHSWGIQAYCTIPHSKSLLKAGQKYGISLRVNNQRVSGISLMTSNSAHRSTEIIASHWDGNKLSAVCMLKEADLVDGLNITVFLWANNTDYEFRDFRIWEIDDLGGNS